MLACLFVYPSLDVLTFHDALGVADADQRDVVEHGTAERAEVVAPGVVVGAKEDDAGAGLARPEAEHGALGPAVALGLVRDLNGVLAGEGLDDHGALAGVGGIANGEGKGVGPAGDGADLLGEGAFLAGEKLDCAAAAGDREVSGVQVLDGLGGVYHPAGEWGVVVFGGRGDEDPPRGVGEDVGPFLKVPVLQQVVCRILHNACRIRNQEVNAPRAQVYCYHDYLLFF